MGPDPALAQPVDAKAQLAAVARLGERAHEIGGNAHHDARLELPGVVARLIKVAARVERLPPVEGTEKESRLRLQLAQHLLEIVAAMPVEDDELADARTFDHADEIG